MSELSEYQPTQSNDDLHMNIYIYIWQCLFATFCVLDEGPEKSAGETVSIKVIFFLIFFLSFVPPFFSGSIWAGRLSLQILLWKIRE